MKRVIVLLTLVCIISTNIYSEITSDFRIFTSAYAYNAENTHFAETQVTLTYFEAFTEGTYNLHFNNLIHLSLGASVFVPFSLELPDYMRVFPIITLQYSNAAISLRLGTLTGGHNLPSALRDPLFDTTPQMRATEENARIPNGNETYKYGKLSHGFYEYGISLEWFKGGSGELYMNWQLLHTSEHRERFDVGFNHAFSQIKIFTPYIGGHYWHNGGHEYAFAPNTPALTENYTASVGINSKELSILYLASLNFTDRDGEPGTFGHGIFIRGNIDIKKILYIEPSVFVSGYYIDSKHKFISIEGDPFFRVPFYFGLNIGKDIALPYGIGIDIKFVNGVFSTYSGDIGVRYDQAIKFNIEHKFDIPLKQPVNADA